MKTKLYLASVILLFFWQTSPAQSPYLQWATRAGSNNSGVNGHSVVVDGSGNVYTTGVFSGTAADFDPGDFIQKLDSAGNFVWARKVGSTTDNDNVEGIAVDASGDVYFTGYFYSTVDFDPGPGTFNLTASNLDLFVTKWGQLSKHLASAELVKTKTQGNKITQE